MPTLTILQDHFGGSSREQFNFSIAAPCDFQHIASSYLFGGDGNFACRSRAEQYLGELGREKREQERAA